MAPRLNRRTFWAAPPTEMPASLVSEGAAAGPIQVLFPASTGLEITATALGFVAIATAMLAAVPALDALGLRIPEPWGVLLVLAACVGNIFGSEWICRRAQRRRWIRAVDAEPRPEMVVALTPSSIVVWDERRLREHGRALIAEIQRADVGAAYAPAWAGAGGGLRVAVSGRGSIAFSLHGPPTRQAVQEFVAALNDSTTVA